jgi:hypothetical protein
MKLLANPLLLSDEEYADIHNLAGCNYSPEKIALFLSVDTATFLEHWKNPNSPIRITYNRGVLEAEFKVNLKQKELAESGNITAAQIFLKESEKIKLENLRNQCLFGE